METQEYKNKLLHNVPLVFLGYFWRLHFTAYAALCTLSGRNLCALLKSCAVKCFLIRYKFAACSVLFALFTARRTFHGAKHCGRFIAFSMCFCGTRLLFTCAALRKFHGLWMFMDVMRRLLPARAVLPFRFPFQRRLFWRRVLRRRRLYAVFCRQSLRRHCGRLRRQRGQVPTFQVRP